MTNPTRILVVDDHREIRELVGQLLAREGFTVSIAADGEAARKALNEQTFDLVILDLMLPGEDGLSLCRFMKTTRPAVAVIMVTAKSDEVDRVVGLEVGADDYVVKPFGGRELVARVRAVLRRSQPAASPSEPIPIRTYRFKGWSLDTLARQLESDAGLVVPLSTSEFQLLLTFVSRPQTVLSRDQLLDLTKGRDATPFDRSIDSHISRLRKKLGDDARAPEIIKTVWGGGYVFTPDVVSR